MKLHALGALALCWLCGKVAAQPPLIAILQSGEGGFYAEAVQRFHQELEKQGVLVQTLTFTLKGDRSDKDLPRRLLERKPRVILAVGTDAALLLKAHYERLPTDQQVPVVFTMVVDPVGQGLIEGVERSGRRFAGVALTVRPQRQFQALRDALPSVQRVGVVYNPSDAVSTRLVAQAHADAQRLQLTLVEAHAQEPKQLGEALASLTDKVDALWLIPDPVCAAPEPSQQVIEFAQKHRLPLLAFSESLVRRGALLGAGVDLSEQGALAAEQTIQILNGEPPEALPLLTPRRALTYYNLKTARALGVEIPDMLLNLAQKVYE
ncbi:MAG: ABC transporter substrate-binding protein [Fimbriimonadales bacterium]